MMTKLPQYSMGIGDRFAHQGIAQLAAFTQAKALGVEVAPVWNKSNREHLIVHSVPASVRQEADAAVRAEGWQGRIRRCRPSSASKRSMGSWRAAIFLRWTWPIRSGRPPADADIAQFVPSWSRYGQGIENSRDRRGSGYFPCRIQAIARKYLRCVQEAVEHLPLSGRPRGLENFVTEVSMDETDQPRRRSTWCLSWPPWPAKKSRSRRSPPNFPGCFYKGVDYVGDLRQFEKEFNDDLAVLGFAVRGLPCRRILKLSVHSGSDKFSIYPAIRRCLCGAKPGCTSAIRYPNQ